MKVNSILISEEFKSESLMQIRQKVNFINAITFYQVTKLFSFKKFAKLCFRYVERFFTILYESDNFLQLDYNLVKKILSSSELLVDSELDVINAAGTWLSYDFENRSKYGYNILSKVRLNLLSDHAIQALLNGEMSLGKNSGLISLFSDFFKSSKISREKKIIYSSLSRYCSQKMFDVTISGGMHYKLRMVLPSMQKVNFSNLNGVKKLASMKDRRGRHESVYCRGELYVFGGWVSKNGIVKPGDLVNPHHLVNIQVKSIEKYSISTNTWEYVDKMFDDRDDFNVCAFMDQIYIIGGIYHVDRNLGYLDEDTTDSCVMLNTRKNSWKEVSKMSNARSQASSVVFEGRVVVTGGWNNLLEETNLVEAYDHINDTWSSMPNMIKRRACHCSVAIRNKLFVFSGVGEDDLEHDQCEVFDSTSKRFVLLKQKPKSLKFNITLAAYTFSIGSEIIIIGHRSEKALCYDVEKDKWYEKLLKETNDRFNFCCALIPQIEF